MCSGSTRRRRRLVYGSGGAPRRRRGRDPVSPSPCKSGLWRAATLRVRLRSRRGRWHCLRAPGRRSHCSGPVFWSRGLSSLELRFALLTEGGHAFAGVLGGEEQGELISLEFEAAYEVDVERAVRRRLCVPDGERTVGRDLGRQFPGRVQRFTLGDDAVDEAYLPGLFGAYAAAGEDQFLGQRGPDQARQALGAAHAREYPEADLGEAEGCVLGCYPDVAGERDLTSSAERVAVHGGYGGDGAPLDKGHRCMADLGEALGLQGFHDAHGPDVGPSDKGPLPRSRNDDGARPFCLQIQQRLPDLLDHLHVKGVQLLLAVDGQDGDIVVVLYRNVIHLPPSGRQHFSMSALQLLAD